MLHIIALPTLNDTTISDRHIDVTVSDNINDDQHIIHFANWLTSQKVTTVDASASTTDSSKLFQAAQSPVLANTTQIISHNYNFGGELVDTKHQDFVFKIKWY